jgi:hypothetical protein
MVKQACEFGQRTSLFERGFHSGVPEWRGRAGWRLEGALTRMDKIDMGACEVQAGGTVTRWLLGQKEDGTALAKAGRRIQEIL